MSMPIINHMTDPTPFRSPLQRRHERPRVVLWVGPGARIDEVLGDLDRLPVLTVFAWSHASEIEPVLRRAADERGYRFLCVRDRDDLDAWQVDVVTLVDLSGADCAPNDTQRERRAARRFVDEAFALVEQLELERPLYFVLGNAHGSENGDFLPDALRAVVDFAPSASVWLVDCDAPSEKAAESVCDRN